MPHAPLAKPTRARLSNFAVELVIDLAEQQLEKLCCPEGDAQCARCVVVRGAYRLGLEVEYRRRHEAGRRGAEPETAERETIGRGRGKTGKREIAGRDHQADTPPKVPR